MKINKEFIKKLKPCEPGWKNYLEYYEDWEGTAVEFLELEHIPAEDKQWLILREDFLTKKQLHLYACFCAERVLHIYEKYYPSDDRPRKSIQAKKDWVEGKITDLELAAAVAGSAAGDARDAWAAAMAARDAAWAATMAAAWAAAMAARDAAGSAERSIQLGELRRVIRS